MDRTNGKAPMRGQAHDRLGVWVGTWHAEGESYAAGQSKANPRGSVEKWVSDETIEWIPGRFFVVRRTDGMVGANDIKGIDIFSVEPDSKGYVARAYENHGFMRDYVVHVDGNIWTFTGETERARVEFVNGGNTQNVSWEWRKPGQEWLPLCDRAATRVAA